MQAPQVCRSEEIVRAYGKVATWKWFGYPDGKVHKFLLFGGTGKIPPAIILALTSANEVIAVRQFRHGVNEFVLELPGGNQETDESLEEVATRELLKETGYTAGRLIQLNEGIWFEPVSLDAVFVPFLALGCRRTADVRHDDTEIMETVLIPFDQWMEMVLGGEVHDSKTITVTFLALPYI